MKKEEQDEVRAQLSGIGVDSFTRMRKFMEIQSDLSDAQYWYGLAYAYSASDNNYSIREEIKNLFRSERAERTMMMEEDELRMLDALPDKITVYRGASIIENARREWGISWTLAEERAEFFAYQYWRNLDTIEHPKLVLTATVFKNDVLAYFAGRNEEEIIIHPDACASLEPTISSIGKPRRRRKAEVIKLK